MVKSPDNPEHRLDSWKDIAAFFSRNERTVRRWAKDRGLPVHRIPGAIKGRVFAFESELQEWLAASGETSDSVQLEARSESEQSPEPRSGNFLRPTAKWLAFGLGLALLVIVAFRLNRRASAHASAIAPITSLKAGSARSETSQAEDLYLQGRYYWNKRTPEDLNRAVDYFTQAIVHDPNYANAYVGLADSYNLLREYSAMAPNEAYPRALAAATKAVELDDSSADAHLSLAFVTFYWNWDASGAERQFSRALALDPNSARAHHWYATFLLSSNRFPEALAQIETARGLDPSSIAILADKAQILQVSGQADAGMALLKQIEATEPSFVSAHRYLSESYLARKDYLNYLKEWRQTATLLHDQNELAIERVAEKRFSTGGYEEMLKAVLRAQKQLNAQDAVPAYSLAMTYARLGDKQNSLQCLRTAYDKHDSSLLFLSTEPAFDDMRDDPEFKDLVARINPVRD